MARLSDLPLSIIETILCLIPIQDAGRTSILSKEWRYCWTKLPKLVFEENTFDVSTPYWAELSIPGQRPLERHKWQKDTMSKFISAVGQVLSMHNGPLHEFTLSLLDQEDVEINHILTHLSRKTSLRKLELDFNYKWYSLPLSSVSARTLLHCLSSCPLLKTVILNIGCRFILRGKDGPTFAELLKCLPVIETLSLSFDLIYAFEDLSLCRVRGELPTPLFHLKYLSIHDVCFSRHQELILAFLIKSSPNLEKLTILDNRGWRESSSLGVERYPRIKLESSSRVECYAGIMLEHLNELEIKDLMNHKTRFDFIKLILARSPVLKKVRINGRYNYHEKLEISETLLGGYSRASPEVQIIVDGPIN